LEPSTSALFLKVARLYARPAALQADRINEEFMVSPKNECGARQFWRL
jgi:hypothetical protein